MQAAYGWQWRCEHRIVTQGVLPPVCGPGSSSKPSSEHLSSINVPATLAPTHGPGPSELLIPLSVGVLRPDAVDSPFSAPSSIPKPSSEDVALAFQED